MYENFAELAKSLKGIKPLKEIILIMNPVTYAKVADFLLKNYPDIRVETSKYFPENQVMEKPEINLIPDTIENTTQLYKATQLYWDN